VKQQADARYFLFIHSFNSQHTTTMASTQCDYFEAIHSLADIESVKQQADGEQQRRLSDTYGEQQRRTTAYLVSAMVEASLRPNWFQQGSSVVLQLLKIARQSGNNVLLTASQARTHLNSLKIKGREAALDVKQKFEFAGNKTLESAQDAKLKSLETAQDLKHKLEMAGENLSKKSQETAQDMKAKLQGGLESAQGAALEAKQNLQSTAQLSLSKVQEVAGRLKGVSLGLVDTAIDRVNSAWDNLTHNSNLAFVILEEETERQYRLTSENQVFAITNAFRVASLFKALAPEFYRPSSEPSGAYYCKLVEEVERARRTKQDATDKTARVNAWATSRLITQKFAAPVIPLAPAKAVFVEEIKITKPLPLTM